MPKVNPNAEQRENRELPTRVPFGGFTYKLEVANKDPNFWYYWFRDEGDQLERALSAGYEFVTRRQAGRVLPEALMNRDLHGGNQSLNDDVRVHGGRLHHVRARRQRAQFEPSFGLADAAQSVKSTMKICYRISKKQTVIPKRKMTISSLPAIIYNINHGGLLFQKVMP